jgi:hypothetical protein
MHGAVVGLLEAIGTPSHGEFAAETLALKREIQALARMVRETIAVIE